MSLSLSIFLFLWRASRGRQCCSIRHCSTEVSSYTSNTRLHYLRLPPWYPILVKPPLCHQHSRLIFHVHRVYTSHYCNPFSFSLFTASAPFSLFIYTDLAGQTGTVSFSYLSKLHLLYSQTMANCNLRALMLYERQGSRVRDTEMGSPNQRIIRIVIQAHINLWDCGKLFRPTCTSAFCQTNIAVLRQTPLTRFYDLGSSFQVFVWYPSFIIIIFWC